MQKMEVKKINLWPFSKKEKRASNNNTSFNAVKIVGDFSPVFTGSISNVYENDIVRSCIHCIATHVAKLNMKALGSSNTITPDIMLSPNDIMSQYDFIYKTITNYYLTNNAFIAIVRVNNKVVELVPIDYTSVKFSNDFKYAYFILKNSGKTVVCEYKDLIHIRRHFNDNSMFGENSTQPVNSLIKVSNIINDSIVNAVQSSAKLRGILKYNLTIKESDMKKQVQQFKNDYLDPTSGAGIGALDNKADFIPLTDNSKVIDPTQMAEVKKSIYTYFGLNENILTSNYNEDQFNSFYSSVIEPIAIALSMEFTRKIYSFKELSHGNKIIFSADRLIFANNDTKAKLIAELMPLGVLSLNEARTILELDELDEDKRLQSLNFVDIEKVNDYQLNNKNDDSKDQGVTSNEGKTDQNSDE